MAFAAALVLLALPTGVAQAAGELDTGFDPSANGNIYEVAVQPDGKIIIGGAFTSVGGQARNRVARLNADGTVDTTFNPNVGGTVNTLLLQPDGKILLGGEFTQVAGQTRNRVARLNADGSLDAGFNPNAGGAVYSFAVQPDGKIIVGGFFTQISGQSRNYLVRLTSSGALDAAFNPNVGAGTNNGVSSVALQPDGKILVGGRFTQVAGQSRSHVARLNADGTLAGALAWSYDSVSTVAVQPDGKLLIGGSVPFSGGTVTNFMARINADGTLDAGFNPDVKGYIYAIAIQSDGKVLVGGLFDTVGGQGRKNLARLNSDGTLDTNFDPEADNSVFSVALQADGRVLVTGAFTSISAQTRNQIARLYPEAAPRVAPPTPAPGDSAPPSSSPLATWPKDVKWVNSWTARRGSKAKIRMTMRLAKGQSPASGHEIALICERNCGKQGTVLDKLRQRSPGGRSSGRVWEARFSLPYRGETRFRIVVTAPGYRGRSQQASFTFRAPKKGRKGLVKGPKLIGQRICLEPGSTTVETSCAR